MRTKTIYYKIFLEIFDIKTLLQLIALLGNFSKVPGKLAYPAQKDLFVYLETKTLVQQISFLV